MEKLTERQKEVLDVIKKYIASNGYSPTVREIGNILGLTSPATTQTHIDNLVKKGYIRKKDNLTRTIELLVENEYLNKRNGITTIPFISKENTLNFIEAINNPSNFLSIPTSLVPKGKELFALNIDGKSMINAGICDNDIVIIEKTSHANNKDIVVTINNENNITLKRFFKEKGYFRLQSENDSMDSIILNDITILGKLVGLFRKY